MSTSEVQWGSEVTEMLTSTGTSGDDILLCADLYLCVSSMRNAKSAQNKLTHSFPRKRITSPMTLTFPMRSMLFIIRPVASTEALKNPFPVMAICNNNRRTIVNSTGRVLGEQWAQVYRHLKCWHCKSPVRTKQQTRHDREPLWTAQTNEWYWHNQY